MIGDHAVTNARCSQRSGTGLLYLLCLLLAGCLVAGCGGGATESRPDGSNAGLDARAPDAGTSLDAQVPGDAAGGDALDGGPRPPLEVSADGHWLERGGRRRLLIGDSVTQGWQELGTDFDQDAYVDALARRGISAILLWSYIGIVDQISDARIGYDAPDIWPWARDGGQFDLGTFDDAYFERLRAFATRAGANGIAIIVTVHDGWTKTRFAGHPFNAANGGPLTDRSQYVELAHYDAEMPSTFDPSWGRRERNQFYLERFCDRLIQAIGDLPNVMFEMFNEGEWYNQTDLRAFEQHFLRFFDRRTQAPLVIENDNAFGGDGLRSDPHCDVISHHVGWTADGGAAPLFDFFSNEYEAVPAKPLLLTEPVPAFEGDIAMVDAIMRYMWGTALGGASVVVQDDTSFGFAPMSTMAGMASVRDQVYDREGYLSQFVSDLNLDGAAPDGARASSGVALAGSDWLVAYSEAGDSITLDLQGYPGGLTGRFYDPRTGTYGDSFPLTGGTSDVRVVKPDSGDWVLRVDSAH